MQRASTETVAARLSAILRAQHGLDASVAVFSRAVPAIPKLAGESAPYWVEVTDETAEAEAAARAASVPPIPLTYNNRVNQVSSTSVVIKFATGVAALDY